MLVLKIILTPLLIAVATLVARRWGGLVGGIVAGLPLTSAPVSVFVWAEQGEAFAAEAAVETIRGMAGVVAFAACYAVAAAARAPLALALVAAIAAFAVVAAATLALAPELPLWPALLLLVVATAIAAVLFPRPGPDAARPRPPRWDIPVRMLTATAVVLALTEGASALGPALVGALSPFPVFAGVMATFAHGQCGAAAAIAVLRGVTLSAFAFGAFFAVVAATVGELQLLAYLVAAVVAAIVSVAVVLADRAFARRGRA